MDITLLIVSSCKIIWVHPSDGMMKLAEEGKVVLGGCIISDNDPMWRFSSIINFP